MRRIVPVGPRPVVGWPVILGNSIKYEPAVADIDGDGRDEIAVAVKDCRVFLLDGDGRSMPGWPCETAAWIANGPLLDDIDGDGEYEIAAGSTDGLIHVWNEDGSIERGWPIDLGGKSLSSPLIVRSGQSNEVSILVSVEPGVVHLLSPRGTSRRGWPKTLPHKCYVGNFDRRPTWAADLDGDGVPEILQLTSRPAFLLAWYQDGTRCPGFPIAMGDHLGLGLAVDDRSDPRHIACTTKKESILLDLECGRRISLTPPDSTGSFNGGPWFLSSEEGDQAKDDLVMVSTLDGFVCIWDLEGRLVPGWPVFLDGFIYGLNKSRERHMVYGPPIMADVDGDGGRELILGCYDQHLYCFELDGTPVPGWPIVLDDFIQQALTLAQLDGMGAKELVVGQFGEALFAWHLEPPPPLKSSVTYWETDDYSEWTPAYYAVSIAILLMLLLLVHLLRMELTGYRDSPGRRLRGALVFFLLVLVIRALFFAGDLYRYFKVKDLLSEAESKVRIIMGTEHDRAQALADELAADLCRCETGRFIDPLRALRCLEQISDRHRLEYRFNGILLADRSGRVVQGVGLGRGWVDLSELGLQEGGLQDPILLDDVPAYAVEGSSGVAAGEDTLRFFLLSSLLNKAPNAIADATGFSAQIRVGRRAMAWGGAGPSPYRTVRPWLGIVQPSREIEIARKHHGPGLTVLLAKEDFERPFSQWLDLFAVIILPCIYLLFARRQGDREKVGLKWWWIIAFGALYVAGAALLHHGRFDTGPVPASGRALEVLLHMTGITGAVVALHRASTSRVSRQLNFAMLGSYLLVGLIPIFVIMIINGNLFFEIRRGIIGKMVGELETRAENMVLSYTGNMAFNNRLLHEAPALLKQSTEKSWLNFVAENHNLFNYDLQSAYLTIWARDREDPERYFTGYSYRAPRTGKFYYNRPAWTDGENIRGIFLDNGTAVIRAMRTYRYRNLEMEIVSHIPIDDRILDELEGRLRLLPFLLRIHLEPAWLESSTERSRPAGWYIPYRSELVLQARGWHSGKPRWIIYRASMYIPRGSEVLKVLVPLSILILFPLGLSFWGAYLTYRSTARPLSRLLTGIRRVGEGDLDYRLEDTGQSEIGLAAQSFDVMTDSLRDKVRELADKQRIEEVSELKSRFISMVSHDLKTPLSSIRGATENILEEVAGPVTDRQRTYLEMIMKSSGDLQTMITDLLDLSRIESGRLTLDMEPLDIRHEVEDLMRAIQPLLEMEGMTGRLTVNAEVTTLKGDRTRIWQILNNVVSNALRHSPEGGMVEIVVDDIPVDETAGRRMLRVSVLDEGPGIPEEDASILFEPFYYRTSGTVGSHGSGLGLAIVKQLVELHGGSVHLGSAPAGGAVFSFTLPI